MGYRVINFQNTDELETFIHKDLQYDEVFSIVKHVPKHHREWFINAVETLVENRFGWLYLFRVEVSNDRRAIKKVRW